MDYPRSRWNGWNGNECVYNKDYKKAIEFYSNAIRLYPLEYRYFVNRSFCYDRLKQFDLALEDAQTAVGLHDQWGKCYYRKARALKGLKRFKEAENCFWKVIQLEGKDCVEAHKELEELRQMSQQMDSTVGTVESPEKCKQTSEEIQITDKSKIDAKFSDKHRPKAKKFNKNCSKNSKSNNFYSEIPNANTKCIANPISEHRNEDLMPFCDSKHEKNILKELSDILLNSCISINTQKVQSLTFNGSEQKNNRNDRKTDLIPEHPFGMNTKLNADNEPKRRPNRKDVRKGLDQIVEIWDDSDTNYWSFAGKRSLNRLRISEPTNIWQFRGLYVSNIRPNEQTIEILRKMVSEFGKVTLISLVPQSSKAIINFDNPESPRIAMFKLQGLYLPEICLPNQKLILNFRPLNDSQNYPSLNSASDRQFKNECYFWRTTGCNKSCKLNHIPVNKGVDLQPWMQTKGRYRHHREVRPRLPI